MTILSLHLSLSFSLYFRRTDVGKVILAKMRSLGILTSADLEIIKLEDRSIGLLGISLSNLDERKKLQIVQLSLFK